MTEDLAILAFFSGHPDLLELWEALLPQVMERCPTAHYKVQKTQITFFDRYGFAFVSRRGRRLVVSFGLPAPLDSPRVAQKAEPYPGRWTHHIYVNSASDVDGELLDWMETAWVFAQTKQRR